MNQFSSICLSVLVAIGGVSVTPTATSAATSSFTDIGDSIYRGDIEWLAERGITRGCDADRFCPNDAVTREQMASFLVRMFNLPPSRDDAFTDDEASAHESAINALAAAGITGGCRRDAFCPRASVTREQMAAFLDRAARPPTTEHDYFLDDERSAHTAAIDRIAAAGISGGCSGHLFCPRSVITRGQVAAFLHRLVAPGPVPVALPDTGPLPACRYDDLLTSRRTPDAWGTTLLDTIYAVTPDYVPTDLVDTSAAGLNGGYRVQRLALNDLAAMAAAARSAGRPLAVVSAYRSYATQEAVFAENVARYGYAVALRRSARAGHSEHQLGTTIDVTHAGGAVPWSYSDWAAFPTGAWMRDNAWRFGFVMSYPKGRSAEHCYDYEPWHFRYIGRAAAANLHASGLTLREWIWRRYGP